MKFISLKARNFLSLGQVKIRLADQGILLITGRNLDNPSITNNGAGKSSLWDALSWCLYGKTLRDVGSDEIKNSRTKNGTRVRLKLEDDNGSIWSVERTRGVKTNATLDLTCEGNNVSGQTVTQTQEKILTLVGLDFGSFSSAVIFGQETLRFASLTDKEKKSVLEKLLGLELYEKAYKLTHQEITQKSMVLELSHSSYTKAKERLAELREQRSKYLEKANKEKEEIRINIRKSESKIQLLEQEQHQLEDKLKIIKVKKGKLRHYEEKLIECKENHQEECLKGKEILDSIDNLKHKKTKTCPTCGQDLVSGGNKIIAQLNAQYVEIENRIKALSKDYYLFKSKIKKYRKKISKFEDEGSLEARIETAKTKSVSIEAGIKYAKESKVYSEDAVEELNKQVKRTKKELLEHERDAKEIEKSIKKRKYWEKAFSPSGIRSYILDSIVPFLNQRAKIYSSILTNGALEIQFNTITRLRSGDAIDKFSVDVSNKDGASTYRGNSAGERQRIDLCVAMALKDLARSRNRCRLDLMVFDEVFERLDESGCEKVIELLNQEKNNWGSCFVITHSDSLKQFFSNRIEVVKKDGISSIVEN